jgi:hypothetical protein
VSTLKMNSKPHTRRRSRPENFFTTMTRFRFVGQRRRLGLSYSSALNRRPPILRRFLNPKNTNCYCRSLYPSRNGLKRTPIPLSGNDPRRNNEERLHPVPGTPRRTTATNSAQAFGGRTAIPGARKTQRPERRRFRLGAKAVSRTKREQKLAGKHFNSGTRFPLTKRLRLGQHCKPRPGSRRGLFFSATQIIERSHDATKVLRLLGHCSMIRVN